MTAKRKMATTMGASLLAGGALGLSMFGPSLAGAATGTTNLRASASSPRPGGCGRLGALYLQRGPGPRGR